MPPPPAAAQAERDVVPVVPREPVLQRGVIARRGVDVQRHVELLRGCEDGPEARAVVVRHVGQVVVEHCAAEAEGGDGAAELGGRVFGRGHGEGGEAGEAGGMGADGGGHFVVGVLAGLDFVGVGGEAFKALVWVDVGGEKA